MILPAISPGGWDSAGIQGVIPDAPLLDSKTPEFTFGQTAFRCGTPVRFCGVCGG